MPDLSELIHNWQIAEQVDAFTTRYECECLLSTTLPLQDLCPTRVGRALQRLVDQRELITADYHRMCVENARLQGVVQRLQGVEDP